jgi:hypothetical protein
MAPPATGVGSAIAAPATPGVSDREWTEKQAVDERKNRRIGADRLSTKRPDLPDDWRRADPDVNVGLTVTVPDLISAGINITM